MQFPFRECKKKEIWEMQIIYKHIHQIINLAERKQMYLTWRVTVISLHSSYPMGLRVLSELSKTMETVAFVTPA